MNDFVSKTPIYGVDYDLGYVMCMFTDDSFISKGIYWFTRPLRGSKIKVTHVGIVTGCDEVVEAVPSGIVKGNLTDKFSNPHVHIFFRKPKGWTEEIGYKTAHEALSHVGKHRYNFPLIAVHALSGWLPGRLVNLITFHGFEYLTAWAVSRLGMICSQIVAYVLRKFYEWVGFLKQTPAAVTPMEIALDEEALVPLKVSA